jgi:hypothetical protein
LGVQCEAYNCKKQYVTKCNSDYTRNEDYITLKVEKQVLGPIRQCGDICKVRPPQSRRNESMPASFSR